MLVMHQPDKDLFLQQKKKDNNTFILWLTQYVKTLRISWKNGIIEKSRLEEQFHIFYFLFWRVFWYVYSNISEAKHLGCNSSFLVIQWIYYMKLFVYVFTFLWFFVYQILGNKLPFFDTNPHGWSNRKSRKLLQSGSMPGSLHKHVGWKNGNACNVFNAAWHFVTVTVLHATEINRKKIKFSGFYFMYVWGMLLFNEGFCRKWYKNAGLGYECQSNDND